MKINAAKRELIVYHHHNGCTQKQIANILSISRCAVQHTLKKYREGLQLANRLKTGRPSKLTRREKIIILRESTKIPQLTAREVRHNANLTEAVSVGTIKRVLRSGGLYGRIAKSKPALNSIQKIKRRKYCTEKQHLTETDWHKYIFTDEVKLTIGNNSRKYVRRPNCCKNCAIKPRYIKTTTKFPPHNGMGCYKARWYTRTCTLQWKCGLRRVPKSFK